ncbi:MAG TPA: hypothetical protein PKX12_15915 [Spirochaetota bacterium]|nr:hypothetical protein [Spirochaetota bacterium]
MRKLLFSLLVLCISACSCSMDDEEQDCEQYSDINRYIKATKEGIPWGFLYLITDGKPVRNYSAELPAVYVEFIYWRDQYWRICNGNYQNSQYNNYYSDREYYRFHTDNYARMLKGLYMNAFNLLLHFDGISTLTVTMEPVDPDSTAPPFTLLNITDLTAADIGTDITLDSTSVNRLFRIEYNGELYGSLETGSSLKMNIKSIRPAGEITQIEIKSGSILFNETGNLESVHVEGNINAWRK